MVEGDSIPPPVAFVRRTGTPAQGRKRTSNLRDISNDRRHILRQRQETDWPVRKKRCHGQIAKHGRVIRPLGAIGPKNLHRQPSRRHAARAQVGTFRSEMTRNGRITKSLVSFLRMVDSLTTWPIRPTANRIAAFGGNRRNVWRQSNLAQQIHGEC